MTKTQCFFKMTVAIIIGIILSLLTVVIIVYWRRRKTDKLFEQQIYSKYPIENEDDERGNIVSKIFVHNVYQFDIATKKHQNK